MSHAPVVLITGGSSGFGRAAAKALVERGWRVFATSRHPQADTLDGARMLTLDVRDDQSVRACVETCLDETDGRLDVLVNNAGYVLSGFAEETTLDQARQIFETNFFGAVRMVDAVLPTMRNQRRGRIINVGSLAGRVGTPYRAFYSATKYALEGYCETLRSELHPFHVRVSLIEPGFYRTSLAEHGAEADPMKAYDAFRTRLHDYFVEGVRSGGDPAEVGRLIARVATCRRPRLRYPAGRDAKWLLRIRPLLPEPLFLRGVRQYFQIP